MKIVDLIILSAVVVIFTILAYLKAYSSIIAIIIFAVVYTVICMFDISNRTKRIIYWFIVLMLGVVIAMVLHL